MEQTLVLGKSWYQDSFALTIAPSEFRFIGKIIFQLEKTLFKKRFTQLG